MITEHNAEPHVAAAALRPDSDPSIENQNGKIGPVAKFENVNGALLLDELESLLTRFVILPDHAAETLALWILHTYAFELRDVSTYLGIESPEKRCGKTTLLSVLNRLANRPVAAANISPSAFFRVIEEMRPTLLIDEADTFLRGNDELRGILNAGYTRDTAYVVRVTQADGNGGLHNKPCSSRREEAAEALATGAQGRSPIGSFLIDIYSAIAVTDTDRISSRDLVTWLNRFTDRPWHDLPGLRIVNRGQRKEVTELWLAQQLRPYGIRPKTIRIGDKVKKGYTEADLLDPFKRYVPRSEWEAFKVEHERQRAERELAEAQIKPQSPAPAVSEGS